MVGRYLYLGLALAAPFAFSTPGRASADSTCYPDWKVKQTQYIGCSGMALLSPGNDTRINLLMLLHDRHGDVGVSNATSYDAMDRRGDAQPFDFGVFALAVGQKPQDEDGATFYGTRCISNDKGRVDFDAAIAASHNAKAGISSAELETLTNARAALQPDCASDTPFRPDIARAVVSVSSTAGKAFADYLLAAASFYDGNFAAARTLFLSLSNGPAGWVKEASSYMLGRIELNLAMESAFDDYGYVVESGTNGRELKAAEGAFKAYLTAYPKGRYAASAQGLLRKIYWMGGDNDRLLAEYVAAFKRKNMAGSNVSLADLVQEMDVKVGEKLDIAKANDPAILAMLALKAMRHSDDPAMQGDDKPISRAAIEALKPRFAGQDALYTYVRAAHALYVAKDADGVLRLLPTEVSGDGYLAYSQRALRALALDAKGDPAARAALAAVLESSSKPFQRGSMELALAMHDERSAGLDRVFAVGSPVKDPEVRERLLRFTAGPALLRKQAAAKEAPKQERDVALYALLYKQLSRGDYKGFATDVALIPANTKPFSPDDYSRPTYTNVGIFKWAGQKDGFACPSLKTLATALAGAPKDAPSLVCLGEFVRLNGLDGGASWPDIPGSLDQTPPKDQLGGTASLFAGKPFSRLEAYKSVIASPAADANSKAYALYRAVYCYAPSGYNSCGGVEVPIATRKGWFNQLKKNYPASPWTAKLKYYW
jgi:TolA-binding protein